MKYLFYSFCAICFIGIFIAMGNILNGRIIPEYSQWMMAVGIVGLIGAYLIDEAIWWKKHRD